MSEQTYLRRSDNNERFVAFAFAAADLVVEVDADGNISYAAGAFRSTFGKSQDDYIGCSLNELVASSDHRLLQRALVMVAQAARLTPITVHLADAKRSRRALAGIALAAPDRERRMCLTFSPLPAPPERCASSITPEALERAIGARARAEQAGSVTLLEIVQDSGASAVSSEVLETALEMVAPRMLSGQVAPGRFGLYGTGDPAGSDGLIIALEQLLRSQGFDVAVVSRTLATEGLTQTQVSCTLRRALQVFAREGVAGLGAEGFADGLAGYLRLASRHFHALRQAIKGGRFELAYQPIVSLQDQTLHHYEALIRPHPFPGCKSPQEFVSLVEMAGLSIELDLAVAVAASNAASGAPVPVAFNLSAHSLQGAEFRDPLLDRLKRIPAVSERKIIVEMTETAGIENMTEVRTTAEAIRALGIPFCIDDFGAGTADVQTLRGLPADVVKLDGSYVSNLATGNGRAFAKGMVEIAQAAGAEVVAECVETADQAEMLRDMGVAMGQGWLFGRPDRLPAKPSLPAARRRSTGPEQWG